MSYNPFGVNLCRSRGSWCDNFAHLAHRDDEAEHFPTVRIQGKLMLNYADEQARSLAEEEAHYGNSAYAHGNVSAIHNEKRQLLRRIQYHDFAAEHFGGNVSRTFKYIVNHNDYKPAQLRMKLWFAIRHGSLLLTGDRHQTRVAYNKFVRTTKVTDEEIRIFLDGCT